MCMHEYYLNPYVNRHNNITYNKIKLKCEYLKQDVKKHLNCKKKSRKGEWKNGPLEDNQRTKRGTWSTSTKSDMTCYSASTPTGRWK